MKRRAPVRDRRPEGSGMQESKSEFTVSDAWRETYPRAAIGVLAMRDVANPERHSDLDARKAELESELRARFTNHDRAALKSIPVLRAYDNYYKQFGKSYHVRLQLESVVHKGKTIPGVAALVEAMFMAELKNLLLTAGHDLDAVETPLRVNVATGDESYVRMDGREQILKPRDMTISDARGVISSVVYGPDRRTRITPRTQRVLFTVYAPPGIDGETVRLHLEDIRENVLVVSPDARTDAIEVLAA